MGRVTLRTISAHHAGGVRLTAQKTRILVTGALGQIGSELTTILRQRHGADNVIAADRVNAQPEFSRHGPYETADVTQRHAVDRLIEAYNVGSIYHLAAILSATGESQPQRAWLVNVEGTLNVLESARQLGASKVFVPSSIAAFGPRTPRKLAPQDTVLQPTTMYGVTKVTGELLGEYYVTRYGLDVRGIRYPGIISSETPPGGGTTDYAVDMFYQALEQGRYTCFVGPETTLPMMYMPDCIKATIDLMDADPARLRHHCDFNTAGMSFSAAELAAEIAKHIPHFTVEYAPDFRQAIADSWPRDIDDSAAREEWSWTPQFTLQTMVVDMLSRLRIRLGIAEPAGPAR